MESLKIHRHIPEEIIIEILSRLSVKSILRFKCVSKSWCSLISSKHFVKTHLEKSKKNKTFSHHTIIASPSKSPDTLKGLSLHSMLIKSETHVFSLDIPTNSSKGLSVLCSCNGLICILVNDFDFLLWNPSTREFKELPDFITGVKHTKRGLIRKYGFGFDESSGDYKIYATFFSLSEIHDTGRMYSLKADSWGAEQLSTGVSYVYDIFNESGKFVSGKLHWMQISPPKCKWEIIYLDLKSETFGSVEHPTSLEGYYYPKVAVLDGCLCLSCEYHQDNKLDIWIWKEYGVEDSWSKLFTISYQSESWKTSMMTPLSLYSTMLIMSPNGDVLLNYGSVFVIYDPRENLFRQCYVVEFDSVCNHVGVYFESLVSLLPDDDYVV